MEYKAYSFDLDDNLVKMPTKVSLKDASGEIKFFATLEFEKIRSKMEELGLKLHENSFMAFRDDEQFFRDLEFAEIAGSWENLVNCVAYHANIFSIITARGHHPQTLKAGIKKIIINNFSEEQIEKFKIKFAEKFMYDTGEMTIDEILDIYLSFCKFYPVTHSLIREEFGKDKTVGELKAATFGKFREYVYTFVKEKFGDDVEIKIGFSDDSADNLSNIVNDTLKKQGLFFYHTKENSKKTDFICKD
jgi:hypothetical protein